MANLPGILGQCKFKRINLITGLHTFQEEPSIDANEDGAMEMT
jgi:hypothetical protein